MLFNSDKDNKAAVKELSYFQLSKILSDLVHFSFNGFHVGMALLDLTKGAKGEESTAEVTADSGVNLQPTIRLLDSIANNPSQVDSLDFLFRRLEKELRESVNQGLVDVNQSARLLRVYAMASYQHCRQYQIVETLIKSLAGKIESFQESEVMAVIRAYEYISNDEKFSARLFGDLNATVVESAAENKASVDIGFILNYLNQLFVNKQTQGARDISQAQRDTMVKLLEEKLIAGETVILKYTSALSRILIRTPTSVPVRDHLLKLV